MKRLLLTCLLVVGFAQAFAQKLQIDFLDVGQGDAVLIRTPDGHAALYDAGRNALEVANQLTQLGVTHLDLVVMSHADADHIGGMAEVVEKFSPQAFLSNDLPSATGTYTKTLESLARVGAQGLKATDRIIGLGDQVQLQVLPPEHRNTDQNENSVGILLEFYDFRLVLAGDSEPATQRYWLSKFASKLAHVDVYKSSHHGSKSNDTQIWLEALKPQDVVISVGKGNAYGHPSIEAIALYNSVRARVWRTDLEGRISFSVSPSGLYSVKSREIEINRNLRVNPSLDISAFAKRATVTTRPLHNSNQSLIAFEPMQVNALLSIQDANGRVMTGALTTGTYYLTLSNPGFVPIREQVTISDDTKQVVVAVDELQANPSASPTSLTWVGSNLEYAVFVIQDRVFVPDISRLKPGEYTVVYQSRFEPYKLSLVTVRLEADVNLELTTPKLGGRVGVNPRTAIVSSTVVVALSLVISPSWALFNFDQPLSPESNGHNFQGSQTPSATTTVGDLDCRDFPSQASAQAFFDGLGGVGHDPYDLDRDHDGIPCERNEDWTIKPNEPRPGRTASTPAPLITPSVPSTPATQPSPPAPSTPTTTPSSGWCWVNGYTKKNGTQVAGYWRRC